MQGNHRKKSQRPGRKTMRAVFAPWIAGLLLMLCLAGGAWAAELTGRVVGVTDGDTVRLLVERQEIRVRLDQIDAPEKRQSFGSRSKESLSELVFGKTVRAVTSGKDRYGRSLATLYAGNLNANAEQVRRGMAWIYRQYARDDSLYPVEEEARRAKRGLLVRPTPGPALGAAQGAERQETLDPGIARIRVYTALTGEAGRDLVAACRQEAARKARGRGEASCPSPNAARGAGRITGAIARAMSTGGSSRP